MADKIDGRILDDLFAVIEARKKSGGADSYTAQLLAGGAAQTGRKLGEEAIETILAALDKAGDGAGDKKDKGEKLAGEAADVLYHLLVLLAGADVTLEQVYAVLEKRQGVSGLAEKASRKK